jgi:copper chaperone CopZ
MPRPKIESTTQEVKDLEKKLKEVYGKKRGAAMIEAAWQNVEYDVDRSKTSQIECTKLYIEKLKQRL